MTNRYKFIICTRACQIDSSPDGPNAICIYFHPQLINHAFSADQADEMEKHPSLSLVRPDLFPIGPWQPGNLVAGAENGVLCMLPRQRSA